MGNVPKKKTAYITKQRQLGDAGETIACQWYLDHGYIIVDRNVTIARVGEIDIIASRQLGNKTEYVFAEVKTRSSSFAGYGYEAISYQKRICMRNSAMAWIGENIDRSQQRIIWRLDVVSIDVSTDPPKLRVFENIEIQ